MKNNKILRILAVAFILALLAVAVPSVPVLAAPTIDLDPEEGEIDDKINIYGYGFSANATIYIYFSSDRAFVNDRIDYDVTAYEKVEAMYTDDWGDIDDYFYVPSRLSDGTDDEDVHGGDYYIYITYTTNYIRAAAEFTVIAGEITLYPTKGAVGDQVEISGQDFAVEEEITIEYDGDDITNEIVDGEAKTDDDGEFTCTILIPESPAGDHTITAADALGNQGLAELIIETIIPEPPQLVKPAPGETIGWFGGQTPTLDWSDVTDPSGVTYVLEIADKEDFSTVILTRNDLDISQYSLIKIEALDIGTYYWRVKSIDGAYNESEWSDPFEFKVGSFPTWLSKQAFIALIVLLVAVAAGITYLMWLPRHRTSY